MTPALLCAMRRVFTTSNGPVATGPIVAANPPEIKDCTGCNAMPSPSCFPHKNESTCALAVNRHIWFVPFRAMVGPAPFHIAITPSSFMIVRAACNVPLYFKFTLPFCCCKRIFTTSNGVTMHSASTTPAPNPAAMRLPVVNFPSSSLSAA